MPGVVQPAGKGPVSRLLRMSALIDAAADLIERMKMGVPFFFNEARCRAGPGELVLRADIGLDVGVEG